MDAPHKAGHDNGLMTKSIFTIGHSNHTIEHFVGLLRRHNVTALADVRSTPYSRFNPQFNRERLADSLRAAGIAYVFLGEELGGKRPGVSHAEIARTDAFRRGLERLLEMAATHRLAMMCAEREPLDCHRCLLISRELERAGDTVTHILADGSLEENRQAMGRLIERLGLPTDDLFAGTSEQIDAAYDAQAAKVAWAPKAGKDSGVRRSKPNA